MQQTVLFYPKFSDFLSPYYVYSKTRTSPLAHILPIYIVMKILSAYTIQMHFRLDFILEVNTMNPDQTASKGNNSQRR